MKKVRRKTATTEARTNCIKKHTFKVIQGIPIDQSQNILIFFSDKLLSYLP